MALKLFQLISTPLKTWFTWTDNLTLDQHCIPLTPCSIVNNNLLKNIFSLKSAEKKGIQLRPEKQCSFKIMIVRGEGFTSLPKGNALLCVLHSPTVLKDRFHYQVCGLLYCCLSVWPILDCLKHRETIYFSAPVTRGEHKKPAFSQFRKLASPCGLLSEHRLNK